MTADGSDCGEFSRMPENIESIPAIVINLKASKARHAFQKEQLDRLNVEHVFFDALRPSDIAIAEMEKRSTQWGRPLRENEVACLLSHRKVWSKIAEGHRPFLVLEDDAVLSDDAEILLQALWSFEDVDCVVLETFNKPKLLSTTIRRVGNTRYALRELLHDRGGAAAYILWPEGARKLLAFTESLSPIADSALFLAPGVRRFQVEPAAAIQDRFLNPDNSTLKMSTVADTRAPRFTIGNGYLRGRSIRLRASLIIAARRLASLGRAREIIVPFIREPGLSQIRTKDSPRHSTVPMP